MSLKFLLRLDVNETSCSGRRLWASRKSSSKKEEVSEEKVGFINSPMFRLFLYFQTNLYLTFDWWRPEFLWPAFENPPKHPPDLWGDVRLCVYSPANGFGGKNIKVRLIFFLEKLLEPGWLKRNSVFCRVNVNPSSLTSNISWITSSPPSSPPSLHSSITHSLRKVN